MCTVTLIARRNGYCLGMNRDEQRSRVAGLPPERRAVKGRAMIGPSEPGDGMWIALNDSAATLALINWYSIPTRVNTNIVSRGDVVRNAGHATSPAEVQAALAQLPLKRMNPFRLIGVFPKTREVAEWRWDLKKLACTSHGWKTRQWISSGFDEPAAQSVRGKTFRQAQRQRSTGSLDWLRRLHRSHSPQTGPFSTCMHRADAATVSYTEISISPRGDVMRYHAGAPCQNLGCSLPSTAGFLEKQTKKAIALRQSF
jgi:hypothetical protein